MKPLIRPTAYWEPEALEAELSRFERELWIFVGLSDDLKTHNDFLTVTVGNQPVVIQNFHGELKAFKNVCTHRFSTLQTECAGNRALVCPYHGWNYDKNGKPIGIPSKPHFGEIDSDTLQSLHLTPWKVDSVGKFVFVQAMSGSKSLIDYLGDTAETLLQFSDGIGNQIDKNQLDLACNWKIAVENTLESYHVAAVHQNTFLRLGTSGEKFQFQGLHSNWTTCLNQKTLDQWAKVQHLYATRKYQIDGYFHQFIFPNLTIATTFGNSFSIQRFDPVSPGETRFISWVYDTTLESERAVDKAMVAAMGQSIVAFNRSVFLEDKVVCAHVQTGIQHASGEGLLSDIEGRVHGFQNAYKEVMSYEHISA